VILIGLIAAATAGTRAQDGAVSKAASIFSSGVDLVTLHVTVRDRDDRLITDVTEAEFSVFENGRRQQLRFFQPSGLPLALTLMLDTSASMQSGLAAAKSAAIDLIRQMRPDDVAAVVTFDDTVQVLRDFTNDQSALTAAVGQAVPGGTTSLYTAVYIALKELDQVKRVFATNAPRHRIIVVLSDGDDMSSVVGFDELLDMAARSDATIYAIRLRRPAMPDARVRSESVLSRLAEQTGGRAFFPSHAHELQRASRAIASELSGQYALAYESDGGRRDGGFRALSVQIARIGAAARTKRGYVAGPRQARSHN
jgi:Ca-activated chloride channel family protein